MRAIFPYEEKTSDIFSKIKRPVVEVSFWSKLINGWLRYKMIADTGADYTILPKYGSTDLGIDLRKECQIKKTFGIGGKQTVYFLKEKAKIKIAGLRLEIPLGFLNSNDIPPILGREQCLNVFKLLFFNFRTEISL